MVFEEDDDTESVTVDSGLVGVASTVLIALLRRGTLGAVLVASPGRMGETTTGRSDWPCFDGKDDDDDDDEEIRAVASTAPEAVNLGG